jgi:hypothetical protein
MHLSVLRFVVLAATVVGACAFFPLHGGPWSGALRLRNTGLVSRASLSSLLFLPCPPSSRQQILNVAFEHLQHASSAALKMTANSPIDLYANTGQARSEHQN